MGTTQVGAQRTIVRSATGPNYEVCALNQMRIVVLSLLGVPESTQNQAKLK